jgi:hypothetical protein
VKGLFVMREDVCRRVSHGALQTELNAALHHDDGTCTSDSEPMKDSMVTRNSANSRSTRSTSVLAAFLIAFVVVFYPSLFSRDYALCSSSHDIYTVDQPRPRVECIVVSGSRILDSGSQGQCINCLGTICFILSISVDVQSRRRQTMLLARTLGLALGGLKIIRVKPGSIVVPGLAGAAPAYYDPSLQLISTQTPMPTSLSMALRCSYNLTVPSLLMVSYCHCSTRYKLAVNAV